MVFDFPKFLKVNEFSTSDLEVSSYLIHPHNILILGCDSRVMIYNLTKFDLLGFIDTRAKVNTLHLANNNSILLCGECKGYVEVIPLEEMAITDS